MPHAFDVDAETKAALSLLVDGRTGEHTGRRYWMDTRPRPASNNSLGRTAPIGVFFYKDQARRIEASMLDSAVTHFDPRCQLGCVIVNAVSMSRKSGTDAITFFADTASVVKLHESAAHTAPYRNARASALPPDPANAVPYSHAKIAAWFSIARKPKGTMMSWR